MVRDKELEQLRRHYLFTTLSDSEFASIATHSTIHRWSSGGLLFQRGAPAGQFFVVLEGEVRLFLQSTEGAEAAIMRARPGDAFAEAVMFMELPIYPVSAETVGAGHRQRSDPVVAKVLLDFGDQRLTVPHRDLDGVVQRRQRIRWELDVDDGADYLYDLAFSGCCYHLLFLLHRLRLRDRSSAPESPPGAVWAENN